MSNYDTTKDSRMVTGLFRDRDSAERAYNSLADRGYNKDDVTLMMSDDTRKTHFADTDTELGSKAAEGAGIGAGIGGTIGGRSAASEPDTMRRVRTPCRARTAASRSP